MGPIPSKAKLCETSKWTLNTAGGTEAKGRSCQVDCLFPCVSMATVQTQLCTSPPSLLLPSFRLDTISLKLCPVLLPQLHRWRRWLLPRTQPVAPLVLEGHGHMDTHTERERGGTLTPAFQPGKKVIERLSQSLIHTLGLTGAFTRRKRSPPWVFHFFSARKEKGWCVEMQSNPS